jgi:hypothetical protein
VKITAPGAELLGGYEALRAQARGELPPLAPCGLAVFLRGGLVSWMVACPPRARPRPSRVAAGSPATFRGPGALAGANAELARLLAEMALRSQRRCSP